MKPYTQNPSRAESPFKLTVAFRTPFPVLRLFILLSVLCVIILGSPSTVRTDTSPSRIISMSPSITEILFALGVGDRVVGVTDFCKYPEEACRVSSIGGMLNPNIETWITLKPDLIILQGQSQKTLKNAANLGIDTLNVRLDKLENIFLSIKKIGNTLGSRETANRLVTRLKTGIDFYKSRLQGVRRKSVLIILGDSQDPTRDLYAVGRSTFLGELLSISGGENILEKTLGRYPKISKEFIIRQSPEVIIEAGPKLNLSPADLREKRKRWDRFSTIRAVKNDNIHLIGADYILLPGPRLEKIIARFAGAIHPELFSEIPNGKTAKGEQGQ